MILTTYHLTFATLMTQILARYTTLLDGRKTVKMTGRVYLRAIVPIGLMFSLSLICGNLTYLYLSVAFIQMLKATTPVAVLLCSWSMGISQPSLKVFLNVSAIVVGVIIASFGEIKFVMFGFLLQIAGIIFEAMRLTMVQRLLSSAEYKMDPLVSLYYFAPVCAVMNFMVAIFWEVPKVSMEEVYHVGLFTFFLNGLVAFLLNVSVVFLVSSLQPHCPPPGHLAAYQCVSTDWQDLFLGPHPLRCPQGYPARVRLHCDLGNPSLRPSVLRLQHCSCWHGLLQAWIRSAQGIRRRGRSSVGRVRKRAAGASQDHCHCICGVFDLRAVWRPGTNVRACLRPRCSDRERALERGCQQGELAGLIKRSYNRRHG